jgi:lysophospholipase L1-like esterase
MIRKLLFALSVLMLGTHLAAAQTPPPRFAAEIAAFEASDAKTMPAKGGVLFLGSSSIRMWTTLAKDFPGIAAINRGFGGSEIADSTLYADRIVIPYAPKTIVFYAGDNDIEAGKSPAQVLAAFEALTAKVHAALPDTRILFVSIKPSIARWDKIAAMREANRLVRAYVAENPRLGYIDIFDAMLGADGKPRPELFRADGLHMTPAGYAIWRDKVRAALQCPCFRMSPRFPPY